MQNFKPLCTTRYILHISIITPNLKIIGPMVSETKSDDNTSLGLRPRRSKEVATGQVYRDSARILRPLVTFAEQIFFSKYE